MRKLFLRTLLTKLHFLAVFVVGLILVFVSIAVSSYLSRDCEFHTVLVEDAEGRPIKHKSYDLDLLWYGFNQIPDDGLVFWQDILLVSSSTCNQIISFDKNSGKTIWVSEVNGPRSITLDEYRERAYIYSLSGYRRELHALDLNTGNEVWLNDSQNGQRSGISVDITSDNNIMAYTLNLGLTIVDENTGKFNNSLYPFDLTSSILENGYIWRVSNNVLYRFDIGTGDVDWRSENIEFGRCCLRQATIYDGTLYVHFSGNIFAIDLTSGETKWAYRNSEIVSNFAIKGNEIFVLNIDAHLIVLDVVTGEALGTVNFEPPESKYRTAARSDDSIGGSWIDVTNDALAIYFEDTNLLSIYRLP